MCTLGLKGHGVGRYLHYSGIVVTTKLITLKTRGGVCPGDQRRDISEWYEDSGNLQCMFKRFMITVIIK